MPAQQPAALPGPEVLVIADAISADDCAYLADPPASAVVATLMGMNSASPELRLDSSDAMMRRMLGAFGELVETVALEHFGLRPEVVDHLLLRYLPGGYLARHCDNQGEGVVRRRSRWRDQPWPRIPFGVNCYLSGPDEYGGGDLLLDGYEPYRPDRGALVLIRGDIWHRVDRVTAGRRSVLKTLVTVEQL